MDYEAMQRVVVVTIVGILGFVVFVFALIIAARAVTSSVLSVIERYRNKGKGDKRE